MKIKNDFTCAYVVVGRCGIVRMPDGTGAFVLAQSRGLTNRETIENASSQEGHTFSGLSNEHEEEIENTRMASVVPFEIVSVELNLFLYQIAQRTFLVI